MASLGNRAIRQCPFDDAPQSRDGCVFEEIFQVCLDSKHLAEPRHELESHERVASPLEEIVVSTDCSAAEQFGPDFGKGLLDGPPGRYEVGTRCEPRPSGVGKSLAVDLPIGREWKRLQDHEGRGNHVLGNESQEPSSQIGSGDGVQAMARYDIGGQARLAGCIRSGHHDRFAHRRVPCQGGLDLAELHAKPANLDLVIDSPQAFEQPIGPPSSEVAGTVEPSAR